MKLERDEKVSALKEKEMQSATIETVEDTPKELKEVGFIAVTAGEGMSEIFRSLGADYIIEGGQTMNPSTEDMLNAIDQVPAKTVFIFPNNKNIIMAANQASELSEDKQIIVIPTKTVPQGITSIINYVPDMTPEENRDVMLAESENVLTGQVTYAVRDTSIDNKEIKQGDFMGIGDKGILSVGKDMEQVTMEMIREMVTDDQELISIYYGSDIKEEDAESLREKVADEFGACDVELQFGGQPIYYYVISAE